MVLNLFQLIYLYLNQPCMSLWISCYYRNNDVLEWENYINLASRVYCSLPTVNRVVTFLRSLRIIILVRIFRLASQKKEMEKVTRRMVRICISKGPFFIHMLRLCLTVYLFFSLPVCEFTSIFVNFAGIGEQKTVPKGWIWFGPYIRYRFGIIIHFCILLFANVYLFILYIYFFFLLFQTGSLLCPSPHLGNRPCTGIPWE